MSEPINIDKVSSVLIGTSWHDARSNTFSVGWQHFTADEDRLTEPVRGFSFIVNDTGETIYGPMSSIIALVVNE